jgi:hypothetical protein
MALISPGLELSVTDESAYIPGAVGTVPLVFLATEQDKTANGATAAGTTKENAAALQVFTSQRELVTQLGAPIFKQSASGTPIHGTALNEYGLLAAYSTLGLTNRLYSIRADVNLAELEATSIRPVGKADNGTHWLDLNTTDWGVYEWQAATGQFIKRTPILVTDLADVSGAGNYPNGYIGENGDFAIVTVNADYGLAANQLFHKGPTGYWNPVGDDSWQLHHPTVESTELNPVLTLGSSISLNGVTVQTVSGTSVTDLAQDITLAAGLTGVVAKVTASGTLQLFADSTATSDGFTADGVISIVNLSGDLLGELGIVAGDYNSPTVSYASYIDIPAWRASDSVPRPTGSVYVKTTSIGAGVNLAVKKYNSDANTWVAQAVVVAADMVKASYALDPFANGFSIPYGTVVGIASADDTDVTSTGYQSSIRLAVRNVQGKTIQSGTVTGLAGGGVFTVNVSRSGFDTLFGYQLTFNETVTTAADWVTRFSAVGIPEVSASAKGNTITLTHETGGIIVLRDTTGTMVYGAGFTPATHMDDGKGNISLSPWSWLEYEVGFTTPYKAPADNTYWYYGDATTVDIMVNDNGWKGYRNLANDARGYNLTNTDPGGVIVTATKPTSQSDNTALVAGDLWLDTSDLENFPKVYRYNDAKQWVAIDATDRFSQNGIVFADARWDTDGTTDVVAGNLPSIKDLTTSNYLDLDAPNYKLYPRGTLLWNTRRSGYNVKKFVSSYFNEDSFPGEDMPSVTDAWISVSGLKDSGAPFMGSLAQRNMVVKAMKAAVDANTQIREEQFAFNLITAPGFPEVIPNMVALNNDRRNTAFVIGDTPMTLPANSVSIANWANNTDGTGLSTADPYLAVYYPSGRTNDLSGNTVVVPPSHMALRTFVRNDNVSYQWFAPAGVRRGLIDNAADIGYVNSKTGGFVRNGINNGLRDALYENRVNPFTILPGVGLVCWGQKTRNPVASSLDRVNVARLVNYIRTILANAGNAFLFEPNDKITRDQIKNIIEGALNDLVAKRGIYDYLVVCDDSNNTPTRIARNELYVDVAIEPMKAVEFIYIPIRLKNPGDIAAGV